MNEEWVPYESKNVKLKGRFMVGIIDKKKTKLRKCLQCYTVLKCTNSATTPMISHLNTCKKDAKTEFGSIASYFENNEKEGFSLAGQLIYLDNISVNSVCNSPRFKTLFIKAGLKQPTVSNIDHSLTAKYLKRIKLVENYLEGDDKLVLSMDKWTNEHAEKFIGVGVFKNGKKVFLGLVNYEGSCPSHVLKDHVNQLLVKFNIAESRIICVMGDCGSDIVKYCRITGHPHLPCLAHVLNLMARIMLLNQELVSTHDEDTGDELGEVESTESNSVVEQIKDAVKEITKPNNINKGP